MKNFDMMNKVWLMLILFAFGSFTANAQLSGTYTVGGASPDYSTLSVAVSALNSQGVNGPVVFNIRDGNHSGSNWRVSIGNVTGASSTNTVTIKSQSGNKANCVLSNSGSSSANYMIRLNSAKFIIVKDLTLNNTSSSYGRVIEFAGSAQNNTIENCVIKGHTGGNTSNRKARIYGYGSGANNNTIQDNSIEYGSYAIYWRGNNTSSVSTGNVIKNNEIVQPYYGGMYLYYMGSLEVSGNSIERSGSGTSYFYGMQFGYTRDKVLISDNDLDLSPNAYRTYGLYMYYCNRYSQNKTDRPEVKNNNLDINTSSSVYYTYPVYTYFNYYSLYENNTIDVYNARSNGYIYNYLMYYNYYSMFRNNDVKLSKNGGYIRNYLVYRGTKDTADGNNITIDVDGRYSYPYNYMAYFAQDYHVVNNNVDIDAEDRTTYGAYVYYYKGVFANNKIDVDADYASVYGLYLYRASGALIYNNTVVTKTRGSNYTFRAYYNFSPTKVFNNTFHSRSTGNTDYTAYIYHTSSSYDMELRNNIFSKTGTRGRLFYTRDSRRMDADYNLYYAPSGADIFQSVTGNSVTTNSLNTWRSRTDHDMNSLIHDPGYIDANAGDVRIDPDNVNAWAVNGRGEHDTTASTGLGGNTRPGDVTDGVPDIGAYEITPTSTPEYADATPANPVANSTQVFTYGQDTVATVDWGNTVPSSFQMRQYTGTQAGPMPAGVGRMFFYTTATSSDWTHKHTPKVYYKEPWIGDVSSEQNAVIARSSNGGAWEGYNYTNANTNTNLNILAPTNEFDSVGGYTGVENGRIGIRCVENPKGIVIDNIKAFSADITWDAVFNPIGYQIILKKDPAVPTDADWDNSSLATTNAHSAIGLDEDSTYYLFIRSICGLNDTSGYSMDSFTTLITCHTPDVALTAQNDTRVIAYWGDIKTAYKYEYALTKSQTPPSFGTDITKTSVLENYLNDGTDYWVHVKAHCSSIYPTSQWETVPFKTWATSVANVNTDANGLSVYPNPVKDELTISIGGKANGAATVMLLDMTGKVLKAATMDGTQLSMNVSELPAGTYILQYRNDTRKEQVKFNKQ